MSVESFDHYDVTQPLTGLFDEYDLEFLMRLLSLFHELAYFTIELNAVHDRLHYDDLSLKSSDCGVFFELYNNKIRPRQNLITIMLRCLHNCNDLRSIALESLARYPILNEYSFGL